MSHRIVLLLTCLLLPFAVAAQEIRVGETVRVGGRIEVTEPVHESLVAAGGHITVKAPIDGSVRIAGGHVEIDAPIGGDVSVAAGRLELGPNARIAGKLKFFGGEMDRDDAAQVAGGIERAQRTRHRERTTGERFIRGAGWTLALMLLAALIAAALPGPSARLASELRSRPWVTLLLGFLVITCVPMAIILLMITIIGIPVGLLGILFYVALLSVGYVWLSVVLGGLMLQRVKPETAAQTTWRVGAAMLAMLAIALLSYLPIAGGLVTLAALACGAGMIVAAVFHTPTAEGEAAVG